MKKFLCPVLLLIAWLGSTLQAQAPGMPEVPALDTVPAAARQAAASIDPEKIRAHVRFLSSDLLEGRGPGKRGGQLAAEYIATQFALAGRGLRATMAPISRLSPLSPCTRTLIRPPLPLFPQVARPSS